MCAALRWNGGRHLYRSRGRVSIWMRKAPRNPVRLGYRGYRAQGRGVLGTAPSPERNEHLPIRGTSAALRYGRGRPNWPASVCPATLRGRSWRLGVQTHRFPHLTASQLISNQFATPIRTASPRDLFHHLNTVLVELLLCSIIRCLRYSKVSIYPMSRNHRLFAAVSNLALTAG